MPVEPKTARRSQDLDIRLRPPIDTLRSRKYSRKRKSTVDSPGRELEVDDLEPDTFDLRDIRGVPDDERAPSPVTPDPPSRPPTPDTPEQIRRMSLLETTGSGGQDVMQGLLQKLIAQRGQSKRVSQPKIEDP